MENKNTVYSLYTGYDEYDVAFSLEELYEKFKRTCSLRANSPYFLGFCHEKSLPKKEVRYKGEIFNKIVLDEQSLEEIRKGVDEVIKRNEAYVANYSNQLMTGGFILTSRDRAWAIEREIMSKSLVFKEFNELDIGLFSYGKESE